MNINNFFLNVSTKISNICSRMPIDLLPGAISGGIFGRELLIKTASLDTKPEDSNVTVGLKTVANLAIRSSAYGFSEYNPVRLPVFAGWTNLLVAIGKGYIASNLYIQGKEEENKEMINEAKKKALEVAAHVGLAVFDWGTLGLSAKIFDVGAIGYTLLGTALDLNRSSYKIHEEFFDREFRVEEGSEDDEYYEYNDDDSSIPERERENYSELFNEAGDDRYVYRPGESRYHFRLRPRRIENDRRLSEALNREDLEPRGDRIPTTRGSLATLTSKITSLIPQALRSNRKDTGSIAEEREDDGYDFHGALEGEDELDLPEDSFELESDEEESAVVGSSDSFIDDDEEFSLGSSDSEEGSSSDSSFLSGNGRRRKKRGVSGSSSPTIGASEVAFAKDTLSSLGRLSSSEKGGHRLRSPRSRRSRMPYSPSDY